MLPYEVWLRPTNPEVTECLLGRYETDYLASRCAGLIRACVTEGEVVVEFNADAEVPS